MPQQRHLILCLGAGVRPNISLSPARIPSILRSAVCAPSVRCVCPVRTDFGCPARADACAGLLLCSCGWLRRGVACGPGVGPAAGAMHAYAGPSTGAMRRDTFVGRRAADTCGRVLRRNTAALSTPFVSCVAAWYHLRIIVLTTANMVPISVQPEFTARNRTLTGQRTPGARHIMNRLIKCDRPRWLRHPYTWPWPCRR